MSPRRLLPLLLALSAVAVAQDVSHLATGSQVLLTDTVQVQTAPGLRDQVVLTNLAGKPVARGHWLYKPLSVVSQTAVSYTLSDGTSQVLLPKRNLAAKAAFPLVQDEETRALAAELLGKTVWGNGGLHSSCEVVNGYTANLEFSRAQITGLWRTQSPNLYFSPGGGLTQFDMVFNERVSRSALLVTLDRPVGSKVVSAALSSGLESRSGDLMAPAPQRCTRLSVLYASADELRRNLRLSAPPPLPPLPETTVDAVQRSLIGWTKAQVLIHYGSPNEPGTLDEVLKLGAWGYGSGIYDHIQFSFGPDGRVMKAVITQSP